ncbi:MAG: PolC-type DNA polymerase III [Defluviitaleaceae bacterium]|nr:PolC-type DNA polymerase III [Defluviitaleaceae bacterium]
MSKTLSHVFPKAQFSNTVVAALGGAAITRIAINQESRCMRLCLSMPGGVAEEPLNALRWELRRFFPDLADVKVEVDGPIILAAIPTSEPLASISNIPSAAPFAPPFQKNGNTSFRKVKVNKTIPTSRQSLSQELENEQDICVEGIVFNLNKRTLRSGRLLVTFDLHGCDQKDRYNAVSVKFFSSPEEDLPIKKGGALAVRGKIQYDDYVGELLLLADTIAPGSSPKVRPDNAKEKRVELHLHTNMSSMDATSTAAAYVKRAADWGHPAIAITDHGGAQAFPEAAAAARGTGVKILYGMEAYMVDDLSDKPKAQDPEAYKKLSYDHAVIFAANQEGLKNLYTLISISHLDYFYRRPRLLKSSILEYRAGLIIGSACEAGELFRAVRKNKPDEELEKIAAFYDYLEIQPLGNNDYLVRKKLAASQVELKGYNRRIVALGERINKPVAATCDVHFMDANDEIFRRIIQKGDGFDDADQQAPLYFRNTEEMLAEFDYLGEEKAYEVVVTNPRAIADSIDALDPIPRATFPPIVHNAEEDVKKMAMEKVLAQYGNPLPPIVADRMAQELESIIKNGFAGMYITAQKLVQRSEEKGYRVGSRGSIGASLVATMVGITEVNPLPAHYFCPDAQCGFFESDPVNAGLSGFDLPKKDCPNCGQALNRDGHDIHFEIFLGFDGDKEPDIDLNFSGEYQQQAHAHAEEIFGKTQIFKSGTISTLAEKTAYGYVKKYFDAKQENKRKAEINCLVAGCTGIKRTTGQHPGGLIVVPEGHSIYEFCPIQHPANKKDSGVITTHFDYHSLEGCLFKLDILGHDVPTIIRMLEDYTGIDPCTVPLDDKDVLSLFTSTKGMYESNQTGSLGLPEFGTGFVRQMLVETQPTSFSELVRISGLSHGTNVWAGNGQELIKNKVATLKEIIPSRDDIMIYLIHKGVEKKTAFKIMESVRKGKSVTDDEAEMMLDTGVPDWYVDSCKKISYLFPKAHAVAYVLMTVRIAYFKLYHPEAFYAASFSVKTDDFDYAIMCMDEAAAVAEYMRLQGAEKGGDGTNGKGGADTAKDKNTLAALELVLEMYRRGIKFAPLDLYNSEVVKFKPTADGILPPLCTVQGLGQSVAEAIVEAREESKFDTIDDLKERSKVNKTVLELLRKYHVLDGIPESNQMSLFD